MNRRQEKTKVALRKLRIRPKEFGDLLRTRENNPEAEELRTWWQVEKEKEIIVKEYNKGSESNIET